MTDTAPRNGNGSRGVVNAAKQLLSSLPPAFLSLVLINAAFMGIVLWFLGDQMDSRTALAAKILDRCLDVIRSAH